MTRAVRIEFENYGRFRGEHAVELSAGVYGVVATTTADELRSNWQGKSTLLNAFAHALFGWHAFASEDGWISHDEKRGRVLVETSDGWTYKRERTRGKSTQFHLEGPGGKLSGGAAQAEVEKLVGLGEADFFATCFFRQKAMSRFVTMDPAPRLKVVSGWLGLEKGDRCVANAAARLSKAADKLRKASDRAAFQQQLVDKLKPLAELEADVLAAYEQWQRAKANEANEHRYDNAERFAEVDVEGRQARADYDEEVGAVVPRWWEAKRAQEEASAARAETAVALRQAASASAGEFSGQCPVTGSNCPIAAEINGERGKARTRCEALDRKHRAAMESHAEAASKYERRKRGRRERYRAWLRLQKLKRQALELLPDHRWAKANPRPELPHEQTALGIHATAIGNLQAAKDTIAELDRLKGLRGEAEREVELARAAAKTYAAAQRLVAERGLSQIEAGANSLLAEAGVELSVGMKWAREGQGLATQCVECGAMFPASQKVKSCERCGVARGPKLIEKLLVELSDQSGAAEDLGGMAAMLSASAWLRNRRGAAWGSVFLDEPVGACDGHNRKAVVGYVAGMLMGRLGFEQGFLVAHTRDSLDALPGRITIVGEGKWSRFDA